LPVNVSHCAGSLCRGRVNGGSPSPAVFKRPSPAAKAGTAQTWFKELLVLLLADLLAIALTRERFFDALLFTWFQIKGVTLDFLDNVFGLHLALEAAQSIFKGFAFLYSNLCQEKYTSRLSQLGYIHQNTLSGKAICGDFDKIFTSEPAHP